MNGPVNKVKIFRSFRKKQVFSSGGVVGYSVRIQNFRFRQCHSGSSVVVLIFSVPFSPMDICNAGWRNYDVFLGDKSGFFPFFPVELGIPITSPIVGFKEFRLIFGQIPDDDFLAQIFFDIGNVL